MKGLTEENQKKVVDGKINMEKFSIDPDKELTPEGWITREGKFFSCDREWLHGTIASLVLGENEECAEQKAEKLGWVRLSDYGFSCEKKMNQAQQNVLWDYCQKYDLDYESEKEEIERDVRV